MPVTEDTPKFIKPFRFHGVDFTASGGDDMFADCPFCGKAGAFAVNKDTGQWTCHSKASRCGRSGNASTFLKQLVDFAVAETTPTQYEELSEDWGVDPDTLAEYGVGVWPVTNKWVFPTFSPKGKIVDVRTWESGGKIKGTAGCSSQLWNASALTDKKVRTVWICEGEKDGMAVRAAFKSDPTVAVVATPGARVVKADWIPLFSLKEVIVGGDNDEDGARMCEKWTAALKTSVRSISYVHWEDELPEKYDLRDFVKERRLYANSKLVAALKGLVSSEHKSMPWGDSKIESIVTAQRSMNATSISFDKVLKEYGKHLAMTPDLTLALKALFAVHLSTPWPGDPLWMFLVGAPSSGKTELLVSMSDAPDTMYQSSVESKQLCSGFQTTNDPSLIPRMIGRCAIFKDWTELLDSNIQDLKKTYGVFRGMFDGRLERSYGNGVVRVYEGRFHLLAGVTSKIYAFSEATVGERFLKLQLHKPHRKIGDHILDIAMDSVTNEEGKNAALKAIAREFLDKRVEPPNPRDCLGVRFEHIKTLSKLITVARGAVSWIPCGYNREVAYRPEDEAPTRMAKQLTKLAMALCMMLEKPGVDDEVWEVVERVAFNTAYGYNFDIISTMMKMGGKSVILGDLEETVKIPRFTLERRIEELEVMGLLKLCRKKLTLMAGPGHVAITVAPSLRKLWDEAMINSDHSEEVAAAKDDTEAA